MRVHPNDRCKHGLPHFAAHQFKYPCAGFCSPVVHGGHCPVAYGPAQGLVQRVQRVEQQLGISGPLNEESLKYEVLLEKIKAAAEENPEEIANLLENLVVDESIAQNPLASMRKEL